MSYVVRSFLFVGVLVFLTLPEAVHSQAPARDGKSYLKLDFSFPDEISGLRLPGVLLAPGRGPLGAARATWQFEEDLRRLLAANEAMRSSQRLLASLYARDTALAVVVGVDPELRQVERGLFGLATSTMDLTINGSLTLEISSERFENLRCSPFELQNPNSGCRPKWRAPKIDNTLQLDVKGVIGQRIFVDVDLQTSREFANSNTIRAYYQGLDDEFLKRVDVGTVQFRPPSSRFLTTGIPSNNFGAAVTVEHGPFEVQALAATQKGSVVAERHYQVGATTVEPQDRLVRDLDYETGRFFWVVRPDILPGYPRVDPLAPPIDMLSPSQKPQEVRVYRYRSALASVGTNPNLGGITALARNAEGDAEQQVGPLKWELLIPGKDYWLDPSGLWFVLSSKLNPDDFLAVSYRTADDGLVGTFPSVDDPLEADSLLLVAAPNRGPEAGTFRRTMRNAYRVAGADLEPNSLEVSVLLNRAERPAGDVATWLSKFGLAIPTDQAIFDESNRLFPRTRDPGAAEVIRDHFVIFPTLEPFGDEMLVVDPAARNDSLYRVPEYLLFSQGPPSKFQLEFAYTAGGGGDRSTLLLDARQIREGTERITSNGFRLTKGIDYTIDYESGLVTFLDPDGLFGSGVSRVDASFEQRGFFAVAPTSILGLTTRYTIGDLGGINLVGLYQSEATAFNRPPLGFEPRASLLGGITADLNWDLPSVSRFMSRLTGDPVAGRSSLRLDGEVAFSVPDPNRSGEAYLEEFENDQGIPISLRENAWQLGSMPESPAGVEPFGFAAGFDSTDAVQLVWQNLVSNGRGGAQELRPTDIDTNIVIQGSSAISTETVLYMTFHADTAGGIVSFDNRSHWSQPRQDFAPRWRSMVTPLSLTGRDLSRNEFLEFWVFESSARPITSNDMKIVVDLGTVSEDALALAPTSFTVDGIDTTFTGRQYPGAGFLDTERSVTGTFNASSDDIGILGDRPLLTGPTGLSDTLATCKQIVSNLIQVYPWGDLSSRCSAGNGLLDTEDLDGDLLLDAQGNTEDVFRYVVDLNDPKYLVRTGVQTRDPNDSTQVAGWTLYRIPLRDADRTIGQPNIRLIKDLRITYLTPPDNGAPDNVIRFALARMRLVGAPWIARADAPIVGLDGSVAQPRGKVTVSSISTENIELGYTPPPGLGNVGSEISSGSEGLGVQINEKALRIIASDLRSGERAEAYNRLAGGAQSLLSYREMRVWTRGLGEGWDDERLRAFVKVGTDDGNFYYYEQGAGTASWLPEMVIDIDRWRSLRAEVEARFLRGDPPSGADECGGNPQAWIVCDGNYVVHILDPAINPPNLAAVQEVATGIRYLGDGSPIAQTELWTDDIRLTQPISDVGVAMSASARLVAGDVGTVNLNYQSRDGNFRQIGQAPSYRGGRQFTAASTIQLGRFLSSDLGLQIPLTMSFGRSSTQPELITGTDVRGSDLAGLRRPKSGTNSWRLTARRIKTDGSFLTRLLINPVTLAGSWASNSSVSEYSDADNTSWGVDLLWDKQWNSIPIPIGLSGLVGKLPDWLANSAGGKGLANAGLRLAPSLTRFRSSVTRSAGSVTSFTVPITRLADTVLIPTENLTHHWQNSSTLSWRPLGMLNMGGTWQSTRDLREYPDSTTLGRVVGQSRKSFLGIDAGVERDRLVTSSIGITPVLASWLRPRLVTRSNFILSRNLTSRNPIQVDGDTAGAYILPQTLNNSRTREFGLTVEPARLFQRVFGDSSSFGNYFSRIQAVDATWTRTWASTYDLAAFDPSAGYQLATGSFDDFLHQDGVQAVGASDINTARVQGALDLPVGLSATGRYSRTASDRYQRATDDRFVINQTTQLDWPDVTLRWSKALRGGPLSLVTLSTTMLEREARTLLPAPDSLGVPAEVFNNSRTLRPQAQLSFSNGLIVRGNLSLENGDRRSNGNTTRRDVKNLRFDATWFVKLPASISPLRKSLTTSLIFSSLHSNDCLVSKESGTCDSISDVLRTEFTGSISADVVGAVRGGLNVQYVLQELRHLDRKTSTMSLSLTLTVPLTTLGEY